MGEIRFAYGTITRSGVTFQSLPLHKLRSPPVCESRRHDRLTTPFVQRLPSFISVYTQLASHARGNFTRKVSAVPFSFATTKGMGRLCTYEFVTFKVGYTFSLPLVTEMFHFTRFPSATYVFSNGSCGIPRTGFPHSDILGSKVACHLPGAYRRLLRPSSACSVEPFTVCPYALRSL